MTRLGSDTVELRELAEAFSDTARDIELSRVRVERSVGSARWQGPDSDRFKQSWIRHHRSLRSVRLELAEAERELRRNADEQERASDPTPTHGAAAASVTSVTSRSAVSAPNGTSGPAQPAPAQISAKPAPAGPPPHGDPIPLRSESWELSAAVAAALGVSGSARITVADLPGNGSMVSIEELSGASLSAGTSIEFGLDGGAGLDLGADGSVSGGITSRRTWNVRDEELEGFLMRLGVREVWDNGWGLPGPLQPALDWSPMELLTDAAGALILPDVAEPAMVDELVRFGAAASLTAAVGIPAAAVGGTVEHSIGLRRRAGEPGLLFETSAGYRADTPGHARSRTGLWTIEVPLVEGPTQPVILSESRTDGSGETLERRVVEFDRSEVNDRLGSARRHLSNGDPEAAASELGGLWTTADTSTAWRDAAFGEIDSDVHRVDVGAALGPKLGGSLGGGRRLVDYDSS